MARKKPHEEHENHERYLVTYSDLITLLLAFFIILYAMSNVDEAKFDAVSQSLSMAFNSGTTSPIEFNGTENKHARKEATEKELKEMKSTKENNQLNDLKAKVDKVIKDKKLQNKMTTKLDKEGLRIILTNEILFNSGEAKLKTQMKTILKDIAYMVEGLPNDVLVSGHTDNQPIATDKFPSNWELSSARAVAVLKEVLRADRKLNPQHFSASGYGQYHPMGSNKTEYGRQQNRRVEILVKRKNESVSLSNE